MTVFRPRLIDAIKSYRISTFAADLGAGVTVGLVALPLAMAFGIASGVKPENGLFTSIIAGFFISALGGSRVQIGGPAGAFVVIIYGIILQYGLPNLLIATMMAGLILFVMGWTGIGSLIRFIPIAIVIGFTNGIAVLIALSQVKDALGLRIEKMPGDFFSQIKAIAENIGTANEYSILLVAVSLVLLFLWPRLASHVGRFGVAGLPGSAALIGRVPGTIVVLVLATLAAQFLHLPIDTIGSRFGGIPRGFPPFVLPEFNWHLARHLGPPALTIAVLGAIESLLSARVADRMINERHNPNQELMAQGIANFLTPLFGGIPATGNIARTTTNVRTGGQTPISGIIHSLTLLVIVLVAAPWASHIPLAVLAAILLFVAWNMGDWHEFRRLSKFALDYRVKMLSVFFLTIILDLTIAVEVGLALAALSFIYRMSDLTRIESIDLSHYAVAIIPGDRRIVAYKMTGSLFFGTVGKIESLLDQNRNHVLGIVLEMSQVINLDATGLDTLKMLLSALREEGCCLVVAAPSAQPLEFMERTGFIDELGMTNISENLEEALLRARDLALHQLP